MVIDVNMDRNRGTQNNVKAQNLLIEYCDTNSLVDVWRERNPNRKQFTWKREKPILSASRIDFSLLPKEITGWVNDIKLVKGFKIRPFSCAIRT